MKEVIIDGVVTDFVKKYGVNSIAIKDVCKNFLRESIRNFRNEDFELYEEIYSQSPSCQRSVLELRLENEIFNFEHVADQIIERVEEAFNNSLMLNGELNIDFLAEQAQTILDDCFDFLMENGKDTNDEMYRENKDAIISLFTGILKHLPLLAAGGALSLPLTFGVSLVTTLIALIIVLVLGGVYSFAASKFFGVNVPKEQLGLLKSVAGVLKDAASVVKKSSESIQYRYNLIFQNEAECYKKAGLDPKKLGFIAFSSVRDKSIFRQLLFFDSEEKLDKLRNCFLENYLDRISIFFDLYFDCLRKTGNWNQVRAMNDDKFIAMFRMKGKLFPICDEYREKAIKAIQSYEDLVDFIFAKSPDKKSQWLLMLNRYILDIRSSKDKNVQDFRVGKDSNRSPFTKEKFQKTSQDIYR